MSGPHPATPTDWSHGHWHRIHPCIVENVDNQNVAFRCQCLLSQTTQIINPRSDFSHFLEFCYALCFDVIDETANHMISFSHVLFICPLVSCMVMQHNIKVRTLAITEEDMSRGGFFRGVFEGPQCHLMFPCLAPPSLLSHFFFFIKFTFDLPTSEESSVGASKRVKFSQWTVLWSPGGESFQKTETLIKL